MAKSAVCDARCQQFAKEMAKKEETLRMNWFLRNQQRLIDNLGSEKLIRKAKQLQVEIPKTKRQEKDIDILYPMPSWRSTTDGSNITDLMRPIDPKVEADLYKAKVESFISKEKYLSRRYKDKPDDRFYFPYCVSWTYGWRLKDYPPIPTSEFGRQAVIQSEFYRRNSSSLQRDPDWYRLCQTGDPKNFNEILTY